MKNISAEELKVWMQEQKAFELVDVREEWEHQAFNIGGKNIPLGELVQRKAELDPDVPMIIYCEKGIRSVIAIQRLDLHGFTSAYNLKGGMSAWKKQV